MDFGFNLPSKCPWCLSLDSMDHAFSSCEVARQVWYYFSGIFRLDLDFSSNLMVLVQSCWASNAADLPQELGRLLPMFVCWELWKMQNNVLFDNQAPSAGYVIRQVMNL